MQNTIEILNKYHEYLEKFISTLELLSNDNLIEKFLDQKELNETIHPSQAIKLVRDHIYESRNISDRILRRIENWSIEQKIFFIDSVQSELEKLVSVFRGYALTIPQAGLPNFGEGGFYFLVEGSNILLINYRIIYQFSNVCEPLLDRLDAKIEKEINPSFNFKNAQVDSLITDLNLYKGEASSRKTKEIYRKKYEDYKRTFEIYEFYIMLLVCLSVTLVIGQLFAHNFFDALNVSNSITIKLTIVALIATLFTYCFKQISFYRRISEQAHQTYMELEALPEYLIHLPDDKQHEIRFDLAKRYFGQSLFESLREDSISVQEQAKTNSELVKSTLALLDVIKKQNN